MLRAFRLLRRLPPRVRRESPGAMGGRSWQAQPILFDRLPLGHTRNSRFRPGAPLSYGPVNYTPRPCSRTHWNLNAGSAPNPHQ